MLLPNHTEQSITFYQTGMGWHERGSNTYSGNMIPLQLPLNTPGHARCEGVDVDLFLVFLVFNLFPIRVHFVDTRPANIGCGMPALSALTSFAPAFREHETISERSSKQHKWGSISSLSLSIPSSYFPSKSVLRTRQHRRPPANRA